MLQNFRDKLQGTMAKVIVCFIALPFVAFGIDSFFTGGVPKVAMVNGVEITEQELTQAIELQRRSLMAQMGDRIDYTQLEDSVLRGPVLDNLIIRRLIEEVAEESRLVMPSQYVDSVILGDPSFQEDGTFSSQRYENLLRSNGFSPAGYRQMLAEELLLQQVVNGLSRSEFVTEAELEASAKIIQQQRDVRYLLVPAVSAEELEEPGEEAIAARFEEGAKRFVTAETVDLEYLELRIDQLQAPVAEEDVRAEFARQMQDYEAVDRRHAAHILIETGEGVDDASARQSLVDLKTRLAAGEAFGELAREHSQDPGSSAFGGDLGFTSGDTFPPEFEAALAALEVDEVSEPVRTDAGWHLVKLLGLEAGDPPEFEEKRAEIERQLQLQGAKLRFVELVESMADLTFNADDLQEAATGLEMDILTASGVARDSGAGLFADPRLRNAAFSSEVLQERMNSQVVELADDHAVVLRVVQHRESRPKALDEVRAEIVSELRREALEELMRSRGEELIEQLAAGVAIDSLAEQRGLEWQVVLGATRTGSGLDPAILEIAFNLSWARDGVAQHGVANLADGSIAVVEVAKVANGSLDDMAPAMQQQLRTALLQTRFQELSGGFQQRLRSDADVQQL